MKERQANFEILRGVLMFMVVCIHITVWGGILRPESPIGYEDKNWFVSTLLDSVCICAVNCYILISGYFGIQATFLKLLKLIVPIIFYSLCIYGIEVSITRDISLRHTISSLSPTHYWFVAQYVLLFLFSPLLNTILSQSSKTQLEQIILVGYVVLVLFPSFTPFSFEGKRGFGVLNFILLYFVGYYIKKFFSPGFNKYTYLCAYFISVIMIFLSNVFLVKYLNYNRGMGNKFFLYDYIFIHTAAIFLFLFFSKVSIKKVFINKTVLFLSPSFFYIYIIHESWAFRDHMYIFLNCNRYFESPYWLLHTLGIASLIFICSLIIDILRRLFFKVIENWVIQYTSRSYERIKYLIFNNPDFKQK